MILTDENFEKEIKELEDMDLGHIERLLNMSHAIKESEINASESLRETELAKLGSTE